MARAKWVTRACGFTLASVLAGFFCEHPALASEVSDANWMACVEQRAGNDGTSTLIPGDLHEDSRYFVSAEEDGLPDIRYGTATRSEKERLGRLTVKQRKEDGIIKRIRSYSVICCAVGLDRIDSLKDAGQSNRCVECDVVKSANRVLTSCPIRD
jgi:hypothetical protein